MKLKIKRLQKDIVVMPKYMTSGSVAFDVRSIEDVALFPKESRMIHTGLAVEVPIGYELQVRQRSGLSILHPNYIVIGVGTIDQDYRGEIMVPIINNNSISWTILQGDRIAQCVVSPIVKCDIVEVDELSETDRGAGGFGHTGKY